MTDLEVLQTAAMTLIQLVDCLSDSLAHLDNLREVIQDHLTETQKQTSQENSQKT